MCESEDDDDDNVAMTKEWTLPSRRLHKLWDTLIYDDDVKNRLLNYACTAMIFSDQGIDPSIISWNRVVLLHGPPGTGKTSLCQALAQKLSVRFQDRYRGGSQLVEVNAHSLFSKWFSESGKLVAKLFSRIHEMLEDEDVLTFILLDEVESLTAARSAAVSGSEPSDAIRVVNALLTQLDALKSCSNVMILTTTNITGAVDSAFIDRADIKAFIDLPSVHARYEILRSCIQEMTHRGIFCEESQGQLYPFEIISGRDFLYLLQSTREVVRSTDTRTSNLNDRNFRLSLSLGFVAQELKGVSGRSLRKLPFLSYASCQSTLSFGGTHKIDCIQLIRELWRTSQVELAMKEYLSKNEKCDMASAGNVPDPRECPF